MFDKQIQNVIAAGLDYLTGRAFLLLFEHPLDEELLAAARRLVDSAIILKSHFRASHVKAECIALRAVLRQADACKEHFAVLDILEAYAPALAARKLSEMLRVAIFDKRQTATPWR